jgi:hypothetical protein
LRRGVGELPCGFFGHIDGRAALGLPEEAVGSFERAIRMSPIDPLLHRAFAQMG